MVDLRNKVVPTHVHWRLLIIEVDRNLCVSCSSDVDQVINERLEANVTVGRKGKGEIRCVFVQISISLHPVLVNLNDPNDLVEGSIVRDVVIEDVETG